MSAPNAWRIEQAMSAYQSARARLAEDDPDLEMAEATEADVMALLDRVIRAAIDVGRLADDAGAYAKQILERRDRFKRRADELCGLTLAMMSALDEMKLVRGDFTASVRAGLPSVVITDETKLPLDCLRTTIAPDKSAISERLKQGEVIDGAELAIGFPTINIRIK